MKYSKTFSAFLLLLFSIPSPGQNVITIKLDGAINPASSEYIHHSIEQAVERHAECLIIQLNTPGGLLKSTRVIVSDILDSKVPVVVYVSPSGAQAASAGVFVTLAAHIAAMASGTNMGAAHPVTLEGQQDSIMMEKATNDAAAFIRSIAEKRQRNLKWAEESVRKSLSITEREAFDKKVVDLIAKDLPELLAALDGRAVELSSGTVTLHTKNATVELLDMSWSERLLGILSDPNIAYVLFMLGLYGILFELYNPGAILPGIVGVISLILAFYSFHTLPINYAGVALMLFAVVLFVAEIKVVSHGMLTVGGVLSLFLGSMMLIRTGNSLEFIQISWSVIISTIALTLGFFLFVIGAGLRAQLRRPTTGVEGLIGETGEAISNLDPTGRVRLHGEIWNASSSSGKILKGDKIVVVRVDNLTLQVTSSK